MRSTTRAGKTALESCRPKIWAGFGLTELGFGPESVQPAFLLLRTRVQNGCVPPAYQLAGSAQDRGRPPNDIEQRRLYRCSSEAGLCEAAPGQIFGRHEFLGYFPDPPVRESPQLNTHAKRKRVRLG